MRVAGLIGAPDLASVATSINRVPTRDPMPLNFGKIGAIIALLTIAAFVLWLIITAFFATEQADEEVEHTGALELGSSLAG